MTAAHFDDLAEGAAVAIVRDACLRMRSAYSECSACERACPAGVLRTSSQSIELREGCTGCGRCQAACPMRALNVTGFAAAHQPNAVGNGSVTVDCWRAPSQLGAAIRVPCVGGLSVGRLLNLAHATGGPVELLDRGWCDSCPNGGSEHPAARQVEKAATAMREAGVPPSLVPRLRRLPVDHRVAGPLSAPESAQPSSRRSFMTGLTLRAVAAVADARSSTTPRAAPDALSSLPMPSAERQQVLQTLRSFATRYGGRLPKSMFYRVSVATACADHRVCAAACPTGALKRYRNGEMNTAGIAHDASACIGCGHCVDVCPEKAVSLVHGMGDSGAALQAVTAFVQRECADCGAYYAAATRPDETRCMRCRRSANLAYSAFHTLFGAVPGNPRTRDEVH